MIFRFFLAALLAFQTPIMGTGNRGKITPHGTVGPFVGSSASGSWTNTVNATACDSVFATRFITAGNTSPSLNITGFGFAIPAGASIKGIAAKITHEDFTGAGGLTDNNVQLLKAGVATGNNEAGGSWNDFVAPETFSYGGTSDLWGTTWTQSDINNSNFGITINVKNTNISGAATAAVDCATITVTY